MNKQTLQDLFLRGTRAHQQSQLTDALQLYSEVLRHNPYHADALHLLGVVHSQLGKHEEALACISKALRINPDSALYHNNLGEVYLRKGDTERATRCYLKAFGLAPGFAEAAFNLGNVYKLTNQTDKAIAYYTSAIKLSPKHVKAHYNLGNTLLEQGNLRSAAACYRQVIQLDPAFAEAYNNLGVALQERDEWEEAIRQYQKAIELKGNFEEACRNLANALETEGKTEESRQYYGQLVRTHPTRVANLLQADILCPVIFSCGEEISSFRQNLLRTLDKYAGQTIIDDLSQLHYYSVHPPSNLIYQGEDDLPIKKKYAWLFANDFTQAPGKQPSKKKSHVGFVVTAGHEGVFIKCMRGILNHLPREHFKITVVCSAPNGEKIIRPAISNPFVTFLAIPKQFDRAVHAVTQADFDILYYWEVGTDIINYCLPFCQLAPIQCTSWGWPVTSGIPQMNYFISCAGLETQESEGHYTEKLIRLSRLPVYYYHPPAPLLAKSRTEYGLPAGAPIYLCTQNLRKVHPHFDALVARILRTDPSGVAVFIEDRHPYVTHLLQNRFRESNPDLASRVYFLPRMEEEDYLHLLKLSEVALDTLYYGGGANTCYDAFAMGTPVVTLPTLFHRGRYAFAAYQQMGLQDCIARNEEEYVAIAVKLATYPEYRALISKKIAETKGELFEDTRAVEELTSFFLEIR